MGYIEQIIGNNIKKYKKLRNLSLEQLAEKIGINYQNLSKITCGKGFVTADTFEKLCEALDITPSELVSLKNTLPQKLHDEKSIKPLLYQIINDMDIKRAKAFYKLALAFNEAID